MMDRDLAELYGVDTAQLKRAVKRNIERFPPDFMFELTKQELEDRRCQFGSSNGTKMGGVYQVDRTGYWVIKSSGVRMAIP